MLILYGFILFSNNNMYLNAPDNVLVQWVIISSIWVHVIVIGKMLHLDLGELLWLNTSSKRIGGVLVGHYGVVHVYWSIEYKLRCI
jgi:hypothetical protein